MYQPTRRFTFRFRSLVEWNAGVKQLKGTKLRIAVVDNNDQIKATQSTTFNNDQPRSAKQSCSSRGLNIWEASISRPEPFYSMHAHLPFPIPSSFHLLLFLPFPYLEMEGSRTTCHSPKQDRIYHMIFLSAESVVGGISVIGEIYHMWAESVQTLALYKSFTYLLTYLLIRSLWSRRADLIDNTAKQHTSRSNGSLDCQWKGVSAINGLSRHKANFSTELVVGIRREKRDMCWLKVARQHGCRRSVSFFLESKRHYGQAGQPRPSLNVQHWLNNELNDQTSYTLDSDLVVCHTSNLKLHVIRLILFHRQQIQQRIINLQTDPHTFTRLYRGYTTAVRCMNLLTYLLIVLRQHIWQDSSIYLFSCISEVAALLKFG